MSYYNHLESVANDILSEIGKYKEIKAHRIINKYALGNIPFVVYTVIEYKDYNKFEEILIEAIYDKKEGKIINKQEYTIGYFYNSDTKNILKNLDKIKNETYSKLIFYETFLNYGSIFPRIVFPRTSVKVLELFYDTDEMINFYNVFKKIIKTTIPLEIFFTPIYNLLKNYD